MSSYNQEPNDKTKSPRTQQRRKWSRLTTIAFFSICVSMFSFAGIANASDYELLVSDATANETDGTATFTVLLIPAVMAPDEVTIEVYTNDDTAKVVDGDYDAVPLTVLTFTGGMMSIDVNVNINDDATVEGTETFWLETGLVTNTGGVINQSDPTGLGTINDNDSPPIANDDVADAVSEGGSVATVDGGQTNLLHDDTDPDLPSDAISIKTTPVSGPSHGVVTINADGTFSYTHDGSENLSDSFVYEISDSGSNTDTATVDITITPVNDNVPVANDDTGTVAEGGTLNEPANGVLGNDTDADLPGDILTVNAVNGSGANVGAATATTNGTVTLNADGSYTYVHDGSENFTDSFTYTVSDGVNTSAAATVDITITPVNDNNPVVNPQSFNVDENAANATSVGIVVATDADVPGQTLSYMITGGTGQTAFDINPSSGEITVADSAQLDYETTASYSLDVQVTDDGTPTLSNTATMTINVNDLNEAPTANNATVAIDENSANGTLVHTVVATDPDTIAPNNTLNYAITAGNTGSAFAIDSVTGDITVNDSTQLDFETTPTFNLEVTATDGGAPGLKDTAMITVNLNNITFDLTMQKGGTGDGTISPVVGVHTYDDGELVNLSATPAGVPAPGSVFQGWSGDVGTVADPGAQNTTITMNGDYVITATFDQTYEISINDPSVAEGGTAQFSVTVSPSVISGDTISVNYDSNGVSATEGTDFNSVDGGTLTFTDASANPQSIDVTTVLDADVEVNETFTVDLSNPSANVAVIDSQGLGSIQDNDSYVVSITNESVAEGGTAVFTVSVSPAVITGDAVTVNYSSAGVTATEGGDFTSVDGGTLTFTDAAPGPQTINVDTADDAFVEVDETFTVDLSSSSAITPTPIPNSSGTGTITNNDAYTVSISKVSPSPAVEGTDALVTFTVTLANMDPVNGVLGSAKVDVATVEGTAKDGMDYKGGSNTLTFSGMTDSYDVIVPILNELHVENDETFQFDLSNPVGCTIAGTDPETVTIKDDGDVYNVRISSVDTSPVTEANTNVTVTIVLENVDPANGVLPDVSVEYETKNGTASETKGDYTKVPKTKWIFTSDTKTFDVQILDDPLVENDEDFQFLLSNFSGPRIGSILPTNPAIITIHDIDTYDLSIQGVSPDPVSEADTGVKFALVLANFDTDTGLIGPISVDYETNDITATGGLDYVSISPAATLTFTGETEAVNVTINEDTLVENDETFNFTLSNFLGARAGNITGGPGIATIQEDDDKYELAITGVSMNPVTEADTVITFTLALTDVDPTQGVIGPLTVDYETIDNNATGGLDYVAVSPAVTLTFNNEIETVDVAIKNDTLVENDEGFQFKLSNFAGARKGAITNDKEDVTIQDDADTYDVTVQSVSPDPAVEGTDGKVTFTLALANVDPTHGIILPVTVDYATSDGSAIGGDDYTPIPTTTMTFSADTETIDVTVLDDSFVENNETFNLDLSSFNAGARTGSTGGPGTATIQDDGVDAYTVSISNVSKSPVVEGTDADVTFTVSLANMDPANGVVSMVQVDVATVDGTAVDGDDFTGGSNTLIFSGSTDAYDVVVPIKNDIYVENDENFYLDLSNPVSCTITGTDPETVTIQDDGGDAYGVAVDSPPPVTEGDPNITFTVSLTNVDVKNGVRGTVNVDYETSDGSAVAGSDYTAIPITTMTFVNGDGPSKTFDVAVLQDAVVENQESFSVNLSNFSGGGATGGPGTGRINDDPDTYNVSVDSPPAVVEAGGATITFTITLNNVDSLNGVSRAVHVDYATNDGSAVGGDDYTAQPLTTMTFNPGDGPSKTFDVTVLQDTLVENSEDFNVVLSNFDGGGATGVAGTGTIDDDGDTYGMFVDDQTAAEGGTATFTVSLDQAPLSSHSVTVDYATSNGTAVDTQDYTATSGSFAFSSGQTTKTFIVSITDDTVVEFAENFFVDLSNASTNATILDPQGEGTIPIDDKYQVSIDDVTVGEADGTVTFTVSLDQQAQEGAPVTLDFGTANGSATDPTDYTAKSGILSFAAGVDTQTITVDIINDAEVDPAEVFVVNLSNVNPASISNIADNQGECAITDNNFILTVSNPATGSGTVDLSVGSVSGLGGADDLALGPGDSVDFIYQAGDVVTLSDEKEATTPDPGSRFKGHSANPVTIAGHETVTSTFVQLYWLTPVPVSHGTVTPDTPQIVEHGEGLAFTAASDLPDYTIVEDVLVDGASVNGATAPATPALNSTTYTFTNVTANHDIGAIISDYGDDCDTAAPVCCPPDVSTHNGEIRPAGDWDYFKVVTPTVGTLKAYTSGSTDTYGYLLDTNCDPNAAISRNDDKDQHNTNFYIEERNLLPGTYYVAVKHWERHESKPVGTGPYTLHVEFNSDDHGSDPSSATLVTCNSSVGGNLETAGNEDYFAIDLSGDGIFTVSTTGTTDTVGTLMDSSPAVLTQDNNSGTGTNFLIQRNLVKGIYYVAVSHNDSVAGTGTYTLNVDCELTHSIWATAGFGGSISPEGTVSVQDGQDGTFTITPDGSNNVYDVEVDGKSVGAVTTYTFTNVQKNHTIVAYFQLPPDICLDISDTPLDARFQAAPANLMFVLDDSGSMDWTFLTPDTEGMFYFEGDRYRYVFDDPGDNLYGNVLSGSKPRRAWKSQWSGFNRIYYNPNVTYEPWPTLSNAHADFPRSHPWHASPTFNLGLTYLEVDTGAAGDLTIVVDDEDPSPYFEKGPDVVQLIINDRDPQFSRTASNGGQWSSSSSSEAYNDDYYYSRYVGDYTATWTPNFTSDGEYDVYARWRTSSNRSKNVPYTTTYSDGVGGTLTDTVTVDQTVNGGKWVKLGTYFFSAGAGGDVSINYHVSSTSDDRICADAIRFTPTGAAWDWATHGDAYDNHYWWTPSNGDYWARWTPDLPVAGTWEVQVRWYGNNERSTGDRPDAVKYVITHAGGTTEYVPHYSQRKYTGVWVSLGSYDFNAGMGGNVTLTHTRTGAVDTVCADAVRFIPPIPLTIDIKRAHYYTWDDANANTVVDPGEVWLVVVDGSIKYYQFTDADGDDVVDTGELLPVTDLAAVPASVKTGRTYTEERQNFANWYSFYRRRELTATAAVSKVISEMRGVNIGYYSINGLLKQPVLPVKVGVNDQTPTLLNTLYSMVLKANSTPLRRGLRSVGRYFDADDGDSGGLGNSPFATASEGGECQQAFAVVMTDGYWNGGSPNLGNTDGDNNTNWDGNPYGDNYSDTLADVAMYFYERDLSSSLDDIVPVNPEDQATHQHMVTYTVAFGLEGTLNPDDYDFINTFPTWPQPDNDANATKIDDLWHAAKNGRGQYLSAKNPQELIDQMLSIIHNIESRIGSSSSVAVNGDELYETIGSEVRMFQGTYSSDGWIGDVKSYQIDLVSGEVLINSPLWSAAEQLDLQNWDSGRQIATFDGVTGRPFRFDSLTDELKDLLDVNWTTDDTIARAILNYVRGDTSNEQQNGGTFRSRFQILGDIVHASPLHVNDVLYTGANDGMLHAFDATTGTELFAYVPKLVFHNLKELKDPLYTHKYYVDLTPDVEDIYVPAGGAYADGEDNDSDGTVDEADELKLKTILVGGLSKGGRGYYALDITGLDPSTVFTEATVASRVMWEYPNPRVMNATEGRCSSAEKPVKITTAVAHGLSVGDTVEISGVHDEANGTWNVTVVSSATQFEIDKTCEDASGIFYSGSSGKVSEIEPSWADMGFSYSRPAIVNSQAGYIVMFGNGYNSETGIAKLIILDLLTGEPIKVINTQAGGCNGLSSPVPIDVDFDDLVDYVFAGDLNGNLWKFDLTDASVSNWDVAYKSAPYTGGVGTDPEPLFQARSPEGVPQPITSKPDVMDWCTTNGLMVTFGTGKWLGDFDYENTTTETIYGIWDYGDDEDDSEYLGVFDRGATPELSNQLDSVTLLEQTVLPCDPMIATCEGANNDFWVFNNKPLRILTDNVAAIVNPWGTTTETSGGASCGDGEGIIDCEPNNIGANPDPVKLAGWYFDLPLTGERSVSDALIREGRVIYVPYIPEDSPCGAGGDSVIMEMDACTGGQLTKPQFDINEDGIIDENDFVNIGTADDPILVAPTGMKAEGKLQPPAILRVPNTGKERKYFSSSRGKIVTVDEKAVILGITYWQEFE